MRLAIMCGLGAAVAFAVPGIRPDVPTQPAPVAARVANIQILNELSTKNVRTEESNLADIIVDAVRDVDKTDAAIVSASSFTDLTIPKGTATQEQVLKSVEYRDDTIVVVKLTGLQIRRALEHGLSLLPQKNSAFLQVSGILASIDSNADRDKRVTSLRVGSAAVKDDRTYTIAMPAPLANGALGYFKVWDRAKAIDHDTNRTIGQAVADYLTGIKSLGGKTEERLAIKR